MTAGKKSFKNVTTAGHLSKKRREQKSEKRGEMKKTMKKKKEVMRKRYTKTKLVQTVVNAIMMN